MKKIWCTLVSLALCACLAVGAFASAADLTNADIFTNTTFTESMYNSANLGESILANLISDYIEAQIYNIYDGLTNSSSGEPLINPDEWVIDTENKKVLWLYTGDFTYLCGKQKISWTDFGGTYRYVLCTLELISAPDYTGDGTFRKVEMGEGLYYPVNTLVYTFLRSDGVKQRFGVKWLPSRRYQYANRFSLADSNDYVELNYAAWADEAWYLDDFGDFSNSFSISFHEQRMRWAATNDIENSLINGDYTININTTVDNFPEPAWIMSNFIPYTIDDTQNIGNVQSWGDWYMGLYTTNNSDSASSLNDNYLSEEYQKNYYYNDFYVANTKITPDNSVNYYNNAYAPVFNSIFNNNLDVNNLSASLNANLKPTIDLAINGLLDSLFDFYGNMPDIGLSWDSGTSNDYYQIITDNNSPPTTGITVNVTVDITRPFVDAPDTSPNVSIYVPTVTTTALTPAFIQAGANFISLGKDMTDMIGITSTIVWLGVAGVGIMLIFKDW